MDKHAGTCRLWCIWGIDYGIMRTSMAGRYGGMLFGVSIIFAEYISFNPNKDSMHNNTIQK